MTNGTMMIARFLRRIIIFIKAQGLLTVGVVARAHGPSLVDGGSQLVADGVVGDLRGCSA